MERHATYFGRLHANQSGRLELGAVISPERVANIDGEDVDENLGLRAVSILTPHPCNTRLSTHVGLDQNSMKTLDGGRRLSDSKD